MVKFDNLTKDIFINIYLISYLLYSPNPTIEYNFFSVPLGRLENQMEGNEAGEMSLLEVEKFKHRAFVPPTR